MPITNALLIRTAYGWDEETRASSIATHGRREALYGLGAYNSPADVHRVASARLDIIAEPRYQYDAEHSPPTDAELAYHAYGVGDRLPVTAGGAPTSERVMSLAASEDDKTGQAIVTASLHDIVMYASPLENFLAMLAQAAKKMIPGTGGGDWKEAQPVTPPAIPAPVVAWVPTGSTCLTESFSQDSDTDIGTDLTWNVFKLAQSNPTNIFSIQIGGVESYTPTDVPLGTGMAVQSGGALWLAQPYTLSSPPQPHPISSPVFPVGRCEVQIATADTLEGDVTVTGTVAGTGPGGTGAGDFLQQDVIVFAQGSGLVSNAEYGYVFWVRLNATGLIVFYQLSVWTGGVGYFPGTLTRPTAEVDYGSPSIPLSAGDELSMTVTGEGLTARVVCAHNGVTKIDFSNWADFITDNSLSSMSAANLPDVAGGAHHGLWLNGTAAVNGGVRWTGLHDNKVGFSDFAACPA